MANLVPGDRYPPRIQAAPPSLPPNQPATQETLDLREVLGVLRRNRRLIGLIALVVTALAAFVVLRQPPQYRATAVIRLKDTKQSLTGGLQAQAMEQVVGKTTDPLLSLIQVLRSRSITRQVVERTGLRLRRLSDDFSLADVHGLSAPSLLQDTLTLEFTPDAYTLVTDEGRATAPYGSLASVGSISLVVERAPEVREATLELLTEEKAIDRVLQHLITRPLDRTDVVHVEFTATDPRLAQLVTNTAVEVFQSANATQSQQESRRRRLFLEEQLAKTDSALQAAQTALSNFREREEVYSSAEWFAAQQAAMLQLDVKLEELNAERQVFAALLDALRDRPEGESRSLGALVAPGPTANPVISELFVQLVQLQAKRDSVTSGPWGSSAENPDVQRLNTVIANTEQRLVDAAAAHVSGLDARIRSLNDLRGRNAAAIQALPDKEAEEMRLVLQVETSRKLADLLREEYQKARIAEAIEVGQVEVVDMAVLPVEPIGTGRPLKIALGLILGLMFGAGGAFVREHLNTKVVRAEDLETELRLPCLAVIPRIDVNLNGANGTRPRLRLPIRTGGNNNGVERPLEKLVTVGDGRTAGAEAYRTLRTNLLFSQTGGVLNRLVLTSSMPSEGKTTTASNLAVTFAQQGKRVVLIDGDLRKARIHKVFGLTREPGLVDVLAGLAALEDSIRPTDVPNLSILTSGTLPPNPSELLGGPRMREILDELQQQFDLVMIDAPPVLVAGDASILAALNASTIIVLRAGQTDRAAAFASVQQLQAVGARLLGAVLNDPDAKIERDENYYYYAYNYYGED